MIIFQDKDESLAFSTKHDLFITVVGPLFEKFLDNLMEAIRLTLEDQDLQYSLDEISLVSSHEFDELT